MWVRYVVYVLVSNFYLLPCHSVTCTTSRTSDRETRVLLALMKRPTKHFGTLTYIELRACFVAVVCVQSICINIYA